MVWLETVVVCGRCYSHCHLADLGWHHQTVGTLWLASVFCCYERTIEIGPCWIPLFYQPLLKCRVDESDDALVSQSALKLDGIFGRARGAVNLVLAVSVHVPRGMCRFKAKRKTRRRDRILNFLSIDIFDNQFRSTTSIHPLQ